MQNLPITDSEVAIALLGIIPLLHRMFDSKIRNLHSEVLPPHLFMLQIITDQPISQGEICKHLMSGAPTVSATLNILEKRGWVTRERSPHDKRFVMIQITSEGKAVLDGVRKTTIDFFIPLFHELSDEERRIVLTASQILQKRLIQQPHANTE
jgi:DNA-binding MarR family transcriptional regulator